MCVRPPAKPSPSARERRRTKRRGFATGARAVAVRSPPKSPDFYLPEFDVYVEYWGMDTPDYVANMKKKKFLYQRERKKLISLYPSDLDALDEVLRLKLSRYIRV